LQGRTHPEGCVEDAGPNGPSRTPVQTDSRGRLSLRGERVITKSAQIQKLRRLLPPLAWSPSLSEGGCCNIVPGNRRRRRAPEDPCDSKDARAKHGQQPCRLLRPFRSKGSCTKVPGTLRSWRCPGTFLSPLYHLLCSVHLKGGAHKALGISKLLGDLPKLASAAHGGSEKGEGNKLQNCPFLRFFLHFAPYCG